MGAVYDFDKEKITAAIRKANKEVGERHRISEAALLAIVDAVTEECSLFAYAYFDYYQEWVDDIIILEN